MPKKVHRGEVYLCRFDTGAGSEQKGNRPVLVVSNDIGNKNSPTFIASVITSSPKRKFPMHVDIKKGIAGLTQPSTVLTEQIFTIDKTRLIRFMGDLNGHPHLLEKVNEALKLSLALN